MAKVAMAKSGDADGDERDVSQFGQGTSNMPEAIMLGLVVVAVVGVILVGGKKPTPAIDEGVRAVVVRTADTPRTVVVPPCGTGERITSRNVSLQAQTAGATVLQLPASANPRLVLVPRCFASTASAGAKKVARVPSSAFVVPAHKAILPATTASAGHAKIESRLQVLVPSDSPARTIIVPPCEGAGREGQATVLRPRPGSPTALIAPNC